MMVTTVDGIRLYLYPRDHNPPHFHAIYAEHEVLTDIQTPGVLRGELPGKQLKRVLNEQKENRRPCWQSLSVYRISDEQIAAYN